MQRHPDDFHNEPPSEKALLKRNKRVADAVELALDYMAERGDKNTGYRLPLNPLALACCSRLKVSFDTARAYLEANATWEAQDPFELELVNVAWERHAVPPAKAPKGVEVPPRTDTEAGRGRQCLTPN